MKRLNAVMVLLIAVMLAGTTGIAIAETHEHVQNTGINSFVGYTFEYLSKDSKGNIYTRGGAIDNTGTLREVGSKFYEDQAKYGGAISNFTSGTIEKISGSVFERNTATTNGGAIYSDGIFKRIENSEFSSNGATGDTNKGAGYGGAIYADLNRYDLTIADTSFSGNYAYRNGGAIALMNGNLNIVDSTGKTVFTGNTQGVESNDIYLGGKNQKLNLTAYDNGSIRLDGGIDFANVPTININGVTPESSATGTGAVYFNGNSGTASKRATMNFYGGTFSLASDNTITNNINTVYAGKITLYNDTILGFDINDSGYDIFNFSSIGNVNSAKFLLYDSSFNIPINYITEEDKKVVLPLITSSSAFKNYLQFMDSDDNKKVSVLYKYYDDYDEGKTPKYKIRLTTDGKFIISVPKYIDPESNPLAYAVNFDINDTTYSNQNNANATIERTSSNEVTLTLKKDILVDSWEDLPDANKKLKERNIQIPDKLIIKGLKNRNKNITAVDNLDGMILESSDKILSIENVTFKKFKNAIGNQDGKITLANVSFQENTNTDDEGKGSAIDNEGGSITLESKRNKSLFYSNKSVNGGAIYNKGLLKINYSNFGANANTRKKITYSNTATENGGAIYNLQSDIISAGSVAPNLVITNSNFIDNFAKNGGAIYNGYADEVTSTDTSVSVGGTFTRNKASEEGGAIYNTGDLTALSSTFGKKSKTAEANTAQNGGAVANKEGGHYTSENSSYYSNNATGDISKEITEGMGGAIYNANESKVTIKGGNFTSNTADFGGAIYNAEDSILELDAYRYQDRNNRDKYTLSVFTSNVSRNGNGGAIYNKGSILPTFNEYGTIKSLAGRFTKNKATLADQKDILMRYNKETHEYNYVIDATHKAPVSPKGGAIYNEGSLHFAGGELSSNTASSRVYVTVEQYYIGSYTYSEQRTQYAGLGGAIYSNTQITDDNGEVLPLYITNSTLSKNTASEAGGAVYNENAESDLDITNSTFTSNTAKYVKNTVQTVSFNNGTKSKDIKITIKENVGVGGAVYSNSDININTNTEYSYLADEIGGGTTFTSNSAIQGGAIYTEKGVDIYKATFSKNSALYSLTCSNKEIKEEMTQDAKDSGAGSGGAIYANEDVKIKNSSFNSNKATYNGGAIYSKGNVYVNAEDYKDAESLEPLPFTSNFTSNTATNGGAIYSEKGVIVKDSLFTSNKATGGYGGAIYANSNILVVNSDFNKNSAKYGGALYVAEGQTATIINSSFTNNTASEQGGAIYADNGSTVYIIAYNKDINITGNKANGKANSIYLNNATVYLEAYQDPSTGKKYKVTLSDGVTCQEGDASYFYLRGKGIFEIDVAKIVTNMSYSDKESTGADLKLNFEELIKQSSFELTGRSTTSIANNRIGTLALNKLTLGNGTTSNLKIDIDPSTGNYDKIQAETVEGTGVLNVSEVNLTSDSKTPVTVKIGKDSLVTEMTATKAETAQATYRLKAGVDENGYLTARAYGQKAKPCTLAAPVAAQLGGYLTQVNSYDQAFMNMDMNMLKTREERQAEEMANRYAYADNNYTFTPDNGINKNGKGLWVRPYATFERVNLHNGPKVGNIAYGSFFGGDAEIKHLKNGWKRQFSAYIGYNGSTQDFDRQSIDQNGGTLGVMETWYKGNFFTALTANVSGNFADASTDIGKERMAMIMAGVASKTGYNFEFKQGKFIIQPSLLLSYSFVHTFAHNNGLGNRVSSSPLNAIQVAPGIKFIANLKNGWQPYLGVNMRWNIIDKTHFNITDVNILDMSIRPYVEYGIGLQKRWGERFTGYGQAMIRNGGRNGVMLSIGFRWAIGK